MFSIISHCRICKNDISNYDLILDLGVQALTGVFPLPEEKLLKSPVTVVRCRHCGLVQLLETVDPPLMFGDTYGYTSSLNKSMVKHLEDLSNYCKSLVKLTKEDIVVDIGSNDGTFLTNFLDTGSSLLGMDPSAIKFKEKYVNIDLITDFFSRKNYEQYTSNKAKLVTSIACFYDLQDPVLFAKEVSDILADDGIWVIEAAYLPFIIERNCFDGCCHEHLNYYSLNDIKNIADQVGLQLLEVSFNDTNGGSFLAVLHKKNSSNLLINTKIMVEQQTFSNSDYFSGFTNRIIKFKQHLNKTLYDLKQEKKMIYGLGASTKFNVVLQYCNIDQSLITCIYDVNSYKFGRVAPGTKIPIWDERYLEQVDAANSYLLVGPYHFKSALLERNNIKSFRNKGGKLIFPLPEIEIV